MKTISKEAVQALAQYEPYFTTAARGWVRYPGPQALRAIQETLAREGIVLKMPGWCSRCMLTFMQSAGSAYFQAREAAIKAQEEETSTKQRKGRAKAPKSKAQEPAPEDPTPNPVTE